MLRVLTVLNQVLVLFWWIDVLYKPCTGKNTTPVLTTALLSQSHSGPNSVHVMLFVLITLIELPRRDILEQLFDMLHTCRTFLVPVISISYSGPNSVPAFINFEITTIRFYKGMNKHWSE